MNLFRISLLTALLSSAATVSHAQTLDDLIGNDAPGAATAIPAAVGVPRVPAADPRTATASSVAFRFGMVGRTYEGRTGGVLVERVAPGTLADRLTLKPGDVILAVNEHGLMSAQHLQHLVRHDIDLNKDPFYISVLDVPSGRVVSRTYAQRVKRHDDGTSSIFHSGRVFETR